MKYIMDHEGKPWRKYFEDLCSIPHESYNEKGFSDYLVKFAEERGLWCYRDDIWNVIIKKPASPGYEDHPPVMIQSHTDMVCEKVPGSDFNFATDPLQLYVEDGWLKAKNTTLGADAGHGVAYMLAILDDTSLKHPPLEALFSVQEEVGIGGPHHLDYSQVESKQIINFDMMREGAITVACGYVVGGTLFKSVAYKPIKDVPTYELHVGGLFGGHGAANIRKEQANAIKASGRIMYQFMKKYKLNIADYIGGRHPQMNNIPTDAFVTFTCGEAGLEELADIAVTVEAALKVEYEVSDPGLYVEVKKVEDAVKVLTDTSTRSVVELVQVLSTGTFLRSRKVADLPLGSRNMGTLFFDNNMLNIGYMFRAGFSSINEDYIDQIFIIAERFGAVYEEEYRYSGYYDPEDTPMKNIFAKVYKEATGQDPTYFYGHHGTDVGTIVEYVGGMDTLSIGPNTLDIHRPGERLEIASFDRVYGYAVKVLEQL